MIWFGLFLALCAMFALEFGYIGQQRYAALLPPLRLAAPITAAFTLLRSWKWTASFGLGLFGWAFYVAALKFAPISLVQSVLAGGLALLVLVVAWYERVRPSHATIIAAVVAVIGLSVLASGAADQGTGTGVKPHNGPLIWVTALGLVLAVSLLAAGMRFSSAALSGTSAGLFYGVGDVTTKGLLATVHHHAGALAYIEAPLLYITLLMHLGAFVVIQLAFQRGSAVASIGPMTVAMNVVPIAAGFAVFHDPMPHGVLRQTAQIAAFVVVVAAAWVLARAEATIEKTIEEHHVDVAPGAPELIGS